MNSTLISFIKMREDEKIFLFESWIGQNRFTELNISMFLVKSMMYKYHHSKMFTSFFHKLLHHIFSKWHIFY